MFNVLVSENHYFLCLTTTHRSFSHTDVTMIDVGGDLAPTVQQLEQYGVKVLQPHEVDVDYEEEIGVGASGIVYEGRLRPSDALVAVKVYHAMYKFEQVLDALLQYVEAVALRTPSSIRGFLLLPLGITRLSFGQKQTAILLPRGASTLEKAMAKFNRPVLPLLAAVCESASILEAFHEVHEDVAGDVVHFVPRRKWLCHREVKPCDVYFLPIPTHPPPSEVVSDDDHHAVAPPSTSIYTIGDMTHFHKELGQTRWFPGLALPPSSIGIPMTQYTDPALTSTNFGLQGSVHGKATADSDADVFSIAIILWEVLERRSAPSLEEVPFVRNELAPRELRQCIELACAARKEKRCSMKALCAELRYCIRAMAQRIEEDAQYRDRVAQQDVLKQRIYNILAESVRQIQAVYAESSESKGVGYAVEAEAVACGGHLKLAVGSSASSIDMQYRTASFETKTAWSYEPPLNVFLSTVEEANPELKRPPLELVSQVIFTDPIESVETVDLSDGVPKTGSPMLRISNYRQLACTPTLDYPAQCAEGFLVNYTHVVHIDLTSLRRHVRKVGDFFLYGCSGLKELSLDAFEDVTAIGFAFLSGCRAIQYLDMRPFSKVQSLGGDFLHNCTSLEEVDLTPLVDVEDISIGNRLLNGCMALRRVKLPRNIPIECVDVHPGQWVEENDRWWEFTSGARVYFIPRLEEIARTPRN
jgi:hypothetical protein